jgi:hypothetical protein
MVMRIPEAIPIGALTVVFNQMEVAALMHVYISGVPQIHFVQVQLVEGSGMMHLVRWSRVPIFVKQLHFPLFQEPLIKV